MQYAVVRIWKDNPKDCEVVEYVATVEEGLQYISRQKKSPLFDWDVCKYDLD